MSAAANLGTNERPCIGPWSSSGSSATELAGMSRPRFLQELGRRAATVMDLDDDQTNDELRDD